MRHGVFKRIQDFKRRRRGAPRLEASLQVAETELFARRPGSRGGFQRWHEG